MWNGRLFPWWSSIRTLAVAVAVFALAIGGLEWHPNHGEAEGEPHHVLPHRDGMTATDCEPGEPLHAEAGVPVLRDQCPACLHKLRTSGAEAALHDAEATLPALRAALFAHAERADGRRHSPRSPRGPPLA